MSAAKILAYGCHYMAGCAIINMFLNRFREGLSVFKSRINVQNSLFSRENPCYLLATLNKFIDRMSA